MWTAKILASQYICADLSEPCLFFDAIRTQITCTGPYVYYITLSVYDITVSVCYITVSVYDIAV